MNENIQLRSDIQEPFDGAAGWAQLLLLVLGDLVEFLMKTSEC
jgi:hypothetical protein